MTTPSIWALLWQLCHLTTKMSLSIPMYLRYRTWPPSPPGAACISGGRFSAPQAPCAAEPNRKSLMGQRFLPRNVSATHRRRASCEAYADAAFTVRHAAGSAYGAGNKRCSRSWRWGTALAVEPAPAPRFSYERRRSPRAASAGDGRGWAATDLARESRLSQATISAALAGRPVAAKSLGLIARALSRTPVVLDVVDSLLMRERSDVTLD